jgi:hypothetical protein
VRHHVLAQTRLAVRAPAANLTLLCACLCRVDLQVLPKTHKRSPVTLKTLSKTPFSPNLCYLASFLLYGELQISLKMAIEYGLQSGATY